MNENKDHVEHYSSLRKHVESVFGRPIQRSSDFDRLSEDVFRKTGERLSASTLKRFWDYIPSRTVISRTSLDILARYAGFPSFAGFCAEDASQYLNTHVLSSRSLQDGAHLEIRWSPGRRVQLSFLGNNSFQVTASEHSKLQVGDRFEVADFMEGFPLYIGCIHRGTEDLPAYVAGTTGGLTQVKLI